MPQPITSLPQDLFIHSDALHPWDMRKQLSVGANKDVQGWTLSPRLPPAYDAFVPPFNRGETQVLRGRDAPLCPAPNSD